MKRVFSVLVALVLILNVSLGYTLTINFNSKTTTVEVAAGENMVVGLGDRSEAEYSVDSNNVVLRKLGNLREFTMPTEDVVITINKETSEPSPEPEDETYTVSFNSNGGSEVADKTIILGATYGDLQIPQKTGYTFVGWYLDSNCTTSQVISSTIVETENNHILYAKWTANEYTITLDNQEATSAGTTSVTATYGSIMPSITVPSKTGYIFGGYYTEVSGGGTQYYKKDGTSASNWTQTAGITLYAQWTQMGTPEIPNLIDAHDTGVSTVDNVTMYHTGLTLEGNAETNGTIKIYKDGTYYSQTTSNSEGYWSANVDNNQNVWTNWTVSVTDSYGNVSEMSEALGIYSDTIAPSIPVIEQKYHAFDFEYKYSGYSVHPIAQVGTTNTIDPIIDFRNTSKLTNVSRVNIYLSSGGMSADSLVQVFYDTGSGYTEGQKVELLVTAGTEAIHVDIPAGTYNNIRVDIGNAVGLTYQINRIDFTADAGISHKNVVNEISSTDEASGIWGYNTHNSADTTWVGCGTWNEFATPVSLWYGYRAVDRAGNASTHISVPVNTCT